MNPAAKMEYLFAFTSDLGTFPFDATGDPVYDPVVLIVKNGKFEVFE